VTRWPRHALLPGVQQYCKIGTYAAVVRQSLGAPGAETWRSLRRALRSFGRTRRAALQTKK
jgi:hypothetical protein